MKNLRRKKYRKNSFDSPTRAASTSIATPVQYRLMSLLVWPRNGRELERLYSSKHTRIGFGTLYATLRRLRVDELVVAKPDTSDGRLRKFSLTGSGRRVLTKSHEYYTRLTRDAGKSIQSALPAPA